MIIGVTGHRPAKLGGYKVPNNTYKFVMAETAKIVAECKPDKIITGMCIGYDQWVAQLAIKLKIPFIAAIPFVGQELLWPKDTQAHYQDLLAYAEQVEVVSPGAFASWKMQARNQWIVNNSDLIIGAFDGSKGGTYNCLEYSKEMNKKIRTINPLEVKS